MSGVNFISHVLKRKENSVLSGLDIIGISRGKKYVSGYLFPLKIASADCGWKTILMIQKPGYFEVKLNTGHILWQGNLIEKDLLWTKAFPERDFELAADTGDTDQPVTKELRLLNDELIIRVFPGIESGRLEIKVREAKLD